MLGTVKDIKMKTATIEIEENGDQLRYKVVATDGNILPLRYFHTRMEAWEYLTIYEEDNPIRSCEIYSYAPEYLDNYSELRVL